MAEPKWLKGLKEGDYIKEDFDATDKSRYTVEGIDKNDSDWLDKAAKKVNVVEGDGYVKLDAGLLTVNRINWMLRCAFGELTYADDNNQLLRHNKPTDPSKKTLAGRTPDQVGDAMGAVHPHTRNVAPETKKVIYALRNKVDGHDEVKMPVPSGNRHKLILHDYKRAEDKDGNCMGTYERVQDTYPFVKYFCETTGQKLVDNPDATTGAIYKRDEVDAGTDAPKHEEHVEEKKEAKPDTDSGVSEYQLKILKNLL